MRGRSGLEVWRRYARELDPLALATLATYAAATLLLTANVVFWIPGKNPRWLLALLATVSLCVVIHVARRGNRLSQAEALGLCAHMLAWLGILSWTTGSGVAALANGMLLPMVALYAVWLLEPRAGRTVLYAGAVWWLVAILHRGDAMISSLATVLLVQVVLVTELFGRIKRRLDTMATTDMLTGASTRWVVVEAVDRAFAAQRNHGEPFSVMSIDLDGLREINNSRGHQAGDELLIRAVTFWSARLSPHDVLARVGGDEFVVVMRGATREAAERVARRLQVDAPVGFSIGTTQARRSDTIVSLFGRADHWMYQQKQGRRTALSQTGQQVEGDRPGLALIVDEGEVVAGHAGQGRVAG